MKVFRSVLLLSYVLSMHLMADTIYTCYQPTGDAEIVFSTSSISGQPLLSYSDDSGIGFDLMGREMQVEAMPGSIIVGASLLGHPRFSGFAAWFPVVAPEVTHVTPVILLTDNNGTPLPGNDYDCSITRVES